MPTLEQLEALLARGTDSALLRFSLGSEYLKQKHYERAIEHLTHAVAKDPNYSAAWKLLGKALAESGRAAEAARAYEKGIETAEAKGDIQAAKEMRVFLKRLRQ